MIQARREPNALGAFLEAVPAGRAFRKVNESRRGGQGNLERPGLAFCFHQLSHREKLNVQLSSAFREVRGKSAQVAVVRRECAVQLGHQAADGRSLVYEDHIPAGFSKIQRSFNSSHTGPDDKGSVAFYPIMIFHIYPNTVFCPLPNKQKG
jgi:hypothetical protein